MIIIDNTVKTNSPLIFNSFLFGIGFLKTKILKRIKQIINITF